MSLLSWCFQLFFGVCYLAIFSVHAEEKILLCIHGFMRAKSNMSLFESSFQKEGWNVYVWSYPSKLKTIEEHGADLTKVIAFIAKKHPHQPLCFVTHSMGGLILRSAVNHSQCPYEAQIGKAVLIAPPNQGSAYARFLNQFKVFQEIVGSYAGRELFTTEEGGFERLGQFPPSMQILVIAGTCGCNPTIAGKNDGKVGVDETRLSTDHVFKKVFAGHSWICHTPKTVEITKEFLR
jgi:triacylglycerol esterase/lipase EstA (alpha/beta hydrolase family)